MDKRIGRIRLRYGGIRCDPTGGTPRGFCTFTPTPFPPGRNGTAESVRPLPFSFKGSEFTNDLFHRAPSSQLNAGPPPTSYGAFRPISATPSRGSSHNAGPYTPSFAAPGPTSSQFPARPSQPASHLLKRTSLATCLVIVSFQIICILAVYRSNTLANFIELESGALRASMEASTLVAEREKWEGEKENMRHDRESWEKVPEDRIPPGAYWSSVRPAYECRAYGKREYQGTLRNVPKGWGAVDACMNTCVSVKVAWNRPPVEIRRPYRCAFVDGSLHGYWIVDRDQDDCKPKLKDVQDAVS